MADRRPLLALLDRYRAAHPDEEERVERVRALVRSHPDCFWRSCQPGHITASAWIVSDDRRHFLLTHHRKLGRWLQLGGHADGDGDALAVALREAREESGMQRFTPLSADPALPLLDVDVHRIPANRDEPAHEHHDLRFLLIAAAGQPLQISEESHDLRWFEIDRLEEWVSEVSMLRMAHKARRLLAAVR